MQPHLVWTSSATQSSILDVGENITAPGWAAVHARVRVLAPNKQPSGELCFFAVENSLGHTDPSILRLATAIDKATDQLPTMQKKVPAAWLKVFDRLRALSRTSPAASFAFMAASSWSK